MIFHFFVTIVFFTSAVRPYIQMCRTIPTAVDTKSVTLNAMMIEFHRVTPTCRLYSYTARSIIT